MFISSIHVNGEHGLFPPPRYYIAATPRVSIEFENTTRNAGLIDTKIEINIITLNLARRAGFPIRDGPKFINIISQTNHFREFYKVVEEAFIKIKLTINTVPI